MAAGVNNLNPLSLETKNKYGRRAHLIKPNLNNSYFLIWPPKRNFKFFKPNI